MNENNEKQPAKRKQGRITEAVAEVNLAREEIGAMLDIGYSLAFIHKKLCEEDKLSCSYYSLRTNFFGGKTRRIYKIELDSKAKQATSAATQKSDQQSTEPEKVVPQRTQKDALKQSGNAVANPETGGVPEVKPVQRKLLGVSKPDEYTPPPADTALA